MLTQYHDTFGGDAGTETSTVSPLDPDGRVLQSEVRRETRRSSGSTSLGADGVRHQGSSFDQYGRHSSETSITTTEGVLVHESDVDYQGCGYYSRESETKIAWNPAADPTAQPEVVTYDSGC